MLILVLHEFREKFKSLGQFRLFLLLEVIFIFFEIVVVVLIIKFAFFQVFLNI